MVVAVAVNALIVPAGATVRCNYGLRGCGVTRVPLQSASFVEMAGVGL